MTKGRIVSGSLVGAIAATVIAGSCEASLDRNWRVPVPSLVMPRQNRDQNDAPSILSAESGAIGGVAKTQSGATLRRVVVRIDGPARSEIMTGDDGAYRFGGLPFGSYVISASKPGLVAQEDKYGHTFSARQTIQLSQQHAFSLVDFVMTGGAVIHGKVLDEVGDAIGNVAVRAVPRDQGASGGDLRDLRGEREQYVATTNEHGDYRIAGVPPGEYALMAVPNGDSIFRGHNGELLGYPAAYFTGARDDGAAETLRLGADDEIAANLELVPTRAVQIIGGVNDSRGKHAEGGIVRLTKLGTPFPSKIVSIRPDGSFSIQAIVSPGKYLLGASTGGPSTPKLNLGPEIGEVEIAIVSERVLYISVLTRPIRRDVAALSK